MLDESGQGPVGICCGLKEVSSPLVTSGSGEGLGREVDCGKIPPLRLGGGLWEDPCTERCASESVHPRTVALPGFWWLRGAFQTSLLSCASE